MRADMIINKLESALSSKTMFEDISKLVEDLKIELYSSDVKATSCDKAFLKYYKKISKLRDVRPALSYADIQVIDGIERTVMTDSYNLVCKNGNDKVMGITYIDDANKKDKTNMEYPKVDRLIADISCATEYKFDRKEWISKIKNYMKVKTNRSDRGIYYCNINHNSEFIMAFDCKLLIEVLEIVDDNKLEVFGEIKPAQIRSDDYIGMILPVKIHAINEDKYLELEVLESEGK